MPKPYDASMRTVVRRHPEAWARLGGVRVDGPVRVVESDASIVSAASDFLIGIYGKIPFLVNEEFQAAYDPMLPDRLLRYNVIAREKEGLPVESVAILLRPEADGPNLTGELRLGTPNREYLIFRYRVVRVWEIPVEEILAAGVGIIALAPLAKGAEKRLPAVLREVERRFVEELPAPQAKDMLAVTGVLMGLKYPAVLCRAFHRGVKNMKESVFYQMILEEGEKQGIEKGIAKGIEKGLDAGIAALQHVVFTLGSERYGEPSKATRRKIHAIRSLERLQELSERILHCESWAELLQGDTST